MNASEQTRNAAPCPQVELDGLTDFRSSRECGSTEVTRIGYCTRCGSYRREYDQETAEGQRNAGV